MQLPAYRVAEGRWGLMQAGYRLYVDVWFFTNFMMDAAALWSAGRLCGQRAAPGRLMLAAFLGTCASMALFLGLSHYTLYQICVHFFVNPWMVFFCFQSRDKKGFLCQWGITYLAVILLGGFLEWSMQEGAGIWNFVFCLPGAVLFSMICRKLLSYFRRQESTVYDLLLVTKKEEIHAKGFYDTGNLLVDPLVHKPVHIIRKELLQEQIRAEGLHIRLIPFHSLGKEEGLLKAVTLEGMYILQMGRPIYLDHPVFGIAEEKLFQDQRCDVILNGKSMEI